jgi:hypothetical protein
MSIEAMKQALSVLETGEYIGGVTVRLRQAIADAEKPVAKVVLTDTIGLPLLQWLDLDRQFDFKGGEFLYTAPPKRQWVELTDKEIDNLELPDTPTVKQFVRFIEAKLREKNT